MLLEKTLKEGETSEGKIFLTAGLGGMSGAQPKAGNIAKCITVCAEVNPAAAEKRHQQGLGRRDYRQSRPISKSC